MGIHKAFVGVLAMTLLAGPASSAIENQADASVQMYCSEADGSRHPRRIELLQVLSAADTEALREGRLQVAYDRDGDDASRGKVSAIARLLQANGGSRKLGRVSITLNRVTGETVGTTKGGVELGDGDAIRWTFKFRKFGPLNSGQCALVIAGVTRPSEGCGPYPDPSASRYSLPFRPGQESVISQGNCSGIGSHRFAARHAYDFALPLGTEVLAIDGGIVEIVDDSSPDGVGGDDNVVQVRHDDGTFARYVHLAQESALVVLGERVERGQPIASSGNSGSTGGIPHLHLQLTTCDQSGVCGTLPITFNNTSSHPNGLEVGKLYRADSRTNRNYR